MKFKGDIIITDPCYIIKKDSEDWRKCDYGDNMAALGLLIISPNLLVMVIGVAQLGLHLVKM